MAKNLKVKTTFVSKYWGLIVTSHRDRKRDLNGKPSEGLVTGFSCEVGGDLLRSQA